MGAAGEMTQPEALRLAEVSPYLEGGERGQWIIDAADELRRLHAENEAIHQAITDPENQPSQFGTVTFAMYEALEAQRDAIQQVVDEQAEDEGLWFRAETAAEAYLQQELRRLHAAVEGEK